MHQEGVRVGGDQRQKYVSRKTQQQNLGKQDCVSQGKSNLTPQVAKLIQKKQSKIHRCDIANPQVSRFTIDVGEEENLKQIFAGKIKQYGKVFYRTRSHSKKLLQSNRAEVDEQVFLDSCTTDYQEPARCNKSNRFLISFSAKKRRKRVKKDFDQHDIHWVRKRPPKTQGQLVYFNSYEPELNLQQQNPENLLTNNSKDNNNKKNRTKIVGQLEKTILSQQPLKLQYYDIHQSQQQCCSNSCSGDYSSTLQNLEQEFEVFLSEHSKNETQEGYENQIRSLKSTVDNLTQEVANYKQQAENMKIFILDMQNQVSTISLPRQNDRQYDLITWMASQKVGFRYNDQKLQNEVKNNPQITAQFKQLIKNPDMMDVVLDQADYLDKVFRNLKARIECPTPTKASTNQIIENISLNQSPLSSSSNLLK